VFSQILIWLLVATNALGYVYLLYRAWTRVPRRDIDDVVPFLYPVDISLVESLLDPAADFELRWQLNPRAFREAQRRRMRLYLELVRRMSHNSEVLVEYDHARLGNDRVNSEQASKVEDAAIKVRLYSACVRLRLRIWLSLPMNTFGMMPTLAHLRTAADLDGPKAYDDLKAAAAEGFAKLQQTELDALARNL
jgi:hypothetical protein